MIIRFFPHGDGSGAKVVEYLLAAEVAAYDNDRRRIRGQTVKRDILPEVLMGNAEMTKMLIDSNHRKWRYTSGVIAFALADAPSEEEQAEVMASFEHAAFAGMEADQTNVLWVRHLHMGNVELHFLIPRVELIGGRAFNAAPPGAGKYFNAVRDYWNTLKGWADPEALMTRKDIRAVVESKDRSEIRELINAFVTQKIESGEIKNYLGIRHCLSNLRHLGFEIKPLTKKQETRRANKVAAEVSSGGEKKRRRDTRITLREIGATGTDTTYRMEGRIYHEDWTAGDYFAAKTAKGSGSTSKREPTTNEHSIDGLRDAMHRAIDRRAQSNRKRYERVTRRSEKAEPADPSPSGNGNGSSGQKFGNDDECSEISGNERRSYDGRYHDDIIGDLPSGWSDRIPDHVQSGACATNASDSINFATESDHTGRQRAWERLSITEQRRNNTLSNNSTKRTNLPETAIEEKTNVRPDTARERIATLRRDLVETGERQHRDLEFLRRRIEGTSERLQSLRERVDAKFRETIDRVRGRITEIIARIGVIGKTGNDPLGPAKRKRPLIEVTVEAGLDI